MLLRDPNMRTADHTLHVGPKSFDSVGMGITANVFTSAVINRLVIVAPTSNMHERSALIGHQLRAKCNMLDNQRFNDLLCAGGNNVGDAFAAVAFSHPQHNCLVIFALFVSATDKRLVGLNGRFAGTAQSVIAVDVTHILADQVAHAPSGLVGDAKLALDLFSSHTVAGRGEQEHYIEPVPQRRARTLKRSADHRVNVMAAVACVGWLLCQFVKLAQFAAFWAGRVIAKANIKKMGETRIIVWKTCVEGFDCCGFLAHTSNMGILVTYFKGIYAVGNV